MPPARKKRGKRSLQDEIADITSGAAPDVDHDALEWGDGSSARAVLAGASDSEDEGMAAPDLSMEPGRRRMRGAIEMDALKYAGKRVTRDELGLVPSDESSTSGSDAGSDSGSDAVSMDDSSSDADSESDSDASGGDMDSEEDTLAQELALLKAQEDAHNAQLLSMRRKEQGKAHAVQAQCKVWERLLDLRIRLQRAVVLGNRMPQADMLPLFLAESDDAQKGTDDVRKSTCRVLDRLLSLHDAIEGMGGGTNAAPPRKRARMRDAADSDAVWAQLDSLWEDGRAEREELIQRWDKKTQLASGALVKKKFKALNRSLMTQVHAVLQDRERLHRRVHIKRTEYRVLGKPKPKAATTAATPAGDSARKRGRVTVQETDEEIFDDTDFYSHLLKELIERNASSDSRSVVVTAADRVRVRTKKHVDTRASKGRKLRYVVHPKLESFMAQTGDFNDELADRLFPHLFGQ